jgi:hypothetical protein
MIATSKPAVGYIRMSTDKQEDSPARQRRDIDAMAERNGYRITTWYEDHGLTGTESANRPEFRRLLANAKNRRFEAVLLSEQSRMSREDVFDAMQHWKQLRDAGVKNLAKPDQAKLAVAIRQTIASITLGIHDAKCGKISYREITGTLEFHPAFGIDPIEIPDDVLGQRRIWREIGELARRSKQPIHLADVCEMIESPDPSHACYHMRREQEAGLVRKVGHQGGWLAID